MVFQFKTKYQGDKVFTGAKGDMDTQVSWYDEDGKFLKLTYSNEQVQHFIDTAVWIEMPTAPSWYFPGPGDGGKSVMPALYALDLTPLEPTEFEAGFGGVEYTKVWLDESAELTINNDLLMSGNTDSEECHAARSISLAEIRDFSRETGFRVEVCEDFYTLRKEGVEAVYTTESIGGLVAVMSAITLLHNAVDRG